MENGHDARRAPPLRLVVRAAGRCSERDGEVPAVGSTVEADETLLRISKIGPSPLPGDRRPCAYTQLGLAERRLGGDPAEDEGAASPLP